MDGCHEGAHTIAPFRDEQTPELKPTSKTTASRKPVAAPLPQEAPALNPTPPAKAVMKTVLMAQYGWPTEATLPTRKQAAKRS